MSIEIKVEDQGLTAGLNKVIRGLIDYRQLGTWDWVASEFRKVEAEQFGSEGSAGASGKWQSLKPAYATVKARHYGNKPILERTGRLMRSLTSKTGDSVEIQAQQELTLGTRVPYAGYHQSGTGRMARRKVFDPTDEQKRRITAPISKKLKRLTANTRLKDARGF